MVAVADAKALDKGKALGASCNGSTMLPTKVVFAGTVTEKVREMVVSMNIFLSTKVFLEGGITLKLIELDPVERDL